MTLGCYLSLINCDLICKRGVKMLSHILWWGHFYLVGFQDMRTNVCERIVYDEKRRWVAFRHEDKWCDEEIPPKDKCSWCGVRTKIYTSILPSFVLRGSRLLQTGPLRTHWSDWIRQGPTAQRLPGAVSGNSWLHLLHLLHWQRRLPHVWGRLRLDRGRLSWMCVRGQGLPAAGQLLPAG